MKREEIRFTREFSTGDVVVSTTLDEPISGVVVCSYYLLDGEGYNRMTPPPRHVRYKVRWDSLPDEVDDVCEDEIAHIKDFNP